MTPDKFWETAVKWKPPYRWRHSAHDADERFLLWCVAGGYEIDLVLEVFDRIGTNKSKLARAPVLEARYQHVYMQNMKRVAKMAELLGATCDL